jgi:hypothetical protein
MILRDLVRHQKYEKDYKLIDHASKSHMQDEGCVLTKQREFIHGKYEKSIMKLEKILDELDRAKNLQGKASLISTIRHIGLGTELERVKERRIRAKLNCERRSSQIKRILDNLVKDPRKLVR